MQIDISGLDELERELEKMSKGLDVDVLNQWADKILED
jgi:hypothetical protein